MRKWMINFPDTDLAYLPQGTDHLDDYVEAVHWSQDYALYHHGESVDFPADKVIDALEPPGNGFRLAG